LGIVSHLRTYPPDTFTPLTSPTPNNSFEPAAN
jgi:hypothetical protein